MTNHDKLKAKLAERRNAKPVQAARTPLPCIHEGQLLERCHTCPASAESRHVRECEIHGTCTRSFVSSKVWSCDQCKSYEPDTGQNSPIQNTLEKRDFVSQSGRATTRGIVVPGGAGGFAGAVHPLPHAYPVTVVIPHLNTVEQLELAIECWRWQSVRPYILVIDTGSRWEVCEELELRIRRNDCEVHFIRAHGYRHSSAPVTHALDLAHSICRTPYLFHTHSDVFPMRRDFLAFMLAQCSESSPVVGWQMSPRTSTKGSPTRHEWAEAVSHTATAVHMATAHRARLMWSMESYYAHRPHERVNTAGWPDTESPFLLTMKAAGIKPILLGPEPNFQRHFLTAGGINWADHARSFSGLKIGSNGERWEAAKRYMAEAMQEARDRLEQWKSQT